jgi:hypothetical protein
VEAARFVTAGGLFFLGVVRQTEMRARRLVFPCLLVAACGGVAPLDVGENTAAGTTTPSTTTATLMQTLDAKCAQPLGPPDDFMTAAELTQKIRGRWYACPDATQDWLPHGTALDFTFDANGGHFQFLFIDDSGTTFVPQMGTDVSGPLDYLVFTGMEGIADAGPDGAGAGTTETFVQWTDGTPQNNINLYFDRTSDNLEFVPELTQGAQRKLQLRELGGSPAHVVFVPVE